MPYTDGMAVINLIHEKGEIDDEVLEEVNWIVKE